MNINNVIERFIVNEIMMTDDQTKIDPDEDLLENGVLDSLALIRLISFIEEQFEITVEDGEVTPNNFQTLNVMTAFIASKM